MICVHATCVSIDGVGILLRGPSGAGKSDLALRLLAYGAVLVADDHTDLAVREGCLYAVAPASINGLIEVRGIGVVAVDRLVEAKIQLVIDLIEPDEVERMPEEQWCEVIGIPVRRFGIAAFETSTVAKVAIAVQVAIGRLLLASQ